MEYKCELNRDVNYLQAHCKTEKLARIPRNNSCRIGIHPQLWNGSSSLCIVSREGEDLPIKFRESVWKTVKLALALSLKVRRGKKKL